MKGSSSISSGDSPRVADFIAAHWHTILDRYVVEVSKLETAKNWKHTELINTLPEYLHRLMSISRDGQRGDPAKSRQRLEEIHIGLRLRMGATQEEVTSEYRILGRILSSLWEDLPYDQQPAADDIQLLFDELQGAMEQVVETFTGYTLEDRQAEKRALHRLEGLAREILDDEHGETKFPERLGGLLQVIQEALGVDGALFMLVQEDGSLRPSAGSGLLRDLRDGPPVHPLPHTVLATIVTSDEPVYVPDAGRASLKAPEGVPDTGTRSLLGSRLWPQGKLLGVLLVGSRETRSFEPRARRVFETLVDFLSGLVDKALLLSRLREANARLRQSEGLLSAVIEQMPAAVLVAEAPSGRIAIVNRQTARVLRQPYHPASGISEYSRYPGLHPDGRPYEPEDWPLARSLQKGEHVQAEETLILRGDGTVGTFLVSSAPVCNPEGRITAGVVTLTDITARKEAERERQRAFEVLDQGEACLLLDRDFNIMLVNRNQEKVSGTSREDTLGRSFWEVFPEAADPDRKFWQEYHRVMSERVPAQFEEYYPPMDLWTDVSVFPIGDNGISVFFRDITEYKRAGEALHRSEEQNRAIIASLAEGIVLRDAEGVIRMVNSSAERILGLSAARMEGRTWIDPGYQALREDGSILPLDDHPWAVVLRTGEGQRGKVMGIRQPDGRQVWLSINAQPIFQKGGRTLSGVVTSFSDITEQRRQADAERRRAGFEQQLIGIVSHDLRNPLSAITLAAATLLRKPDLHERQRQVISRIVSSAERAGRMIRDLLDFTQARLTGSLPVERRPLDLHELTRQVVDEVRLAEPNRTIEVSEHGDGRGEWDGDRLAQVITNVLNNALHYGTPGTPVRIDTRDEGDSVVLSIHNQGPPIAPETLPRLFQPMERGVSDNASSGRSIGLGLFIVDHIVKAHGGTVQVRSEAVEGTTFIVRLPRSGESDGRTERKG